jgi:anti-sigma B factor antagonist
LEFYYHTVDRDVLIVRADGGIDSHNAGQFLESLGSIVDAGIGKVIVDCTALKYISSYGVGVLVQLHKKVAQRGGEVKLAEVDGGIFRVLRLLRLEKIFHSYPTVEDARLSFEAERHPS